MKRARKHKKAQALAIGAVVKLIGVVLFVIVGILVVQPMMAIGEKVSAEKCQKLFDMKVGVADGMGNMYGGLLDAVPDLGKAYKNFGAGGGTTYALDQVCDWCVWGDPSDIVWKGNRLKDEQSEMELKQALFSALPAVCGTITSTCAGSVREVSKCLHDRIRWTYYALAGKKGPLYSRKQDMFEVEVKVTEPSEEGIYLAGSQCTSMMNTYARSFENSVIEDMTGGGAWCKMNMKAVNQDTIAISAILNCQEQRAGPTDTNCKCFYHPELGYSLDQGFHTHMPGVQLAGYDYTRKSGGKGFLVPYSYPQYKGYWLCGAKQPEETEDYYDEGWLEWRPNCNWKTLSALPGYENSTCILRVGVDVIGETMTVKTESHSSNWGTTQHYSLSWSRTPVKGDTKVVVR